jgi:hypothetical protein
LHHVILPWNKIALNNIRHYPVNLSSESRTNAARVGYLICKAAGAEKLEFAQHYYFKISNEIFFKFQTLVYQVQYFKVSNQWQRGFFYSIQLLESASKK